MNFFKSHFVFSKQQRNGIFLLLLIIIVLQCVYFFVDRSSDEVVIDEIKFAKYSKSIDSLRRIELEKRKPKVYPFNPNYITDYKGASLGMSNEEIDRLLAFRSQEKWVNSKEEFQVVTKISDSLLNKISPLFKFPERINTKKVSKTKALYANVPKKYEQKQDLNTATEDQLKNVYGVGEALSSRIIRYRDKYKGGFIDDVQLEDVYGVTTQLKERILIDFTVKTPRPIEKIKLNEALVDDLVKVQYIDYEIAYNIVEQRKLREGYKSLDELTKVKDFPVNKIGIIKLYLYLD